MIELRDAGSPGTYLITAIDNDTPTDEDVISEEYLMAGHLPSTAQIIFSDDSSYMRVRSEVTRDDGQHWHLWHSSYTSEAYEIPDVQKVRFILSATFDSQGVQHTPTGSVTVKILSFVREVEV